MGYREEVLADNPALFLPLDETSGDYQNHGYVGGTATPMNVNRNSTDRFGNPSGMNVSDAGRHIIAEVPASIFQGKRFTVEYWLTHTSTSGVNSVSDWGRADTSHQFGVAKALSHQISNGRSRVYFGGWTYHSTIYSVDTWRHFVMVVDGNQMTHYINGQLVLTMTDSSSFSSVGGYVVVGDMGHTYWTGSFRGLVDDIAVYSTPLSASRISAHFNATEEMEPAITSFRGWGIPMK